MEPWDDVNSWAIPRRGKKKRRVPFVLQYIIGGVIGLILAYYILLAMGRDLLHR